jgi:hypothetical protein
MCADLHGDWILRCMVGEWLNDDVSARTPICEWLHK